MCSASRSSAPLNLWTIAFSAANVVTTTRADLGVTGVLLSDSQPQEIASVGSNSTVDIVPGVCGDMNGDKLVNVFDAIFDLQIIVGLVSPTSAHMILGDVVRDGQINVFDVILTLQHIVGSTVITSCGPPAATINFRDGQWEPPWMSNTIATIIVDGYPG